MTWTAPDLVEALYEDADVLPSWDVVRSWFVCECGERVHHASVPCPCGGIASERWPKGRDQREFMLAVIANAVLDRATLSVVAVKPQRGCNAFGTPSPMVDGCRNDSFRCGGQIVHTGYAMADLADTTFLARQRLGPGIPLDPGYGTSFYFEGELATLYAHKGARPWKVTSAGIVMLRDEL